MAKVDKEPVGQETEEKLKTVGSDHWNRKQHWVHYGPDYSRVDPKAECWRQDLSLGAKGDRLKISKERENELDKLYEEYLVNKKR